MKVCQGCSSSLIILFKNADFFLVIKVPGVLFADLFLLVKKLPWLDLTWELCQLVGEKWYATIETTLDIVELKSKIQGYHHAFQAHKAKMKHIQKVI